jgi:DNA polymerase-3 subunit gamma/tau
MAYRALYREYRPQLFAEIMGQRHIVDTLENALKNNRIAHAYLFCGPRGTGKTSTAKILAKALNCHQIKGVEPCNKCSSCVSVAQGSAIDVIEIDAASNRGIDEIRDLKERVKFAPTGGKYKVYIVDEVHMLTIEAFNALLKTLEEPPEHVIFVLATTEPHKLPLTILSRCQRFDFKSIGAEAMTSRLKDILQDLQVKISPAALELIVQAAEGGLRDALSILDQIITFNNTAEISEEDIHNLLGTVNERVINSLLEYLLRGDAGGSLQVIAEISLEGKDLKMFVKGFASCVRDLLLQSIEPTAIKNFSRTDQIYSVEYLLALLDCLTELEPKMKFSSQPRVILELALIKFIYSRRDHLLQSINTKESTEIQNNQDMRVSLPSEVKLPADDQEKLLAENTDNSKLVKSYDLPVAEKNEQKDNISINRVKNSWKLVLEEIRKAMPAIAVPLSDGYPVRIENNVLSIGIRNDFNRQRLDSNQKCRDIIKQTIKSILGWECQFKFIEVSELAQDIPETEDITTQSIINLFEA